jgi:agmatine deiminase
MIRLPAEWEKQDTILMSFPHKYSDWANDLKSALSVFVRMASSICFNQKLILVCDDIQKTKELFCYHDKISFVSLKTDDTWIRDYGPITIYEDEKRKLIDFQFNAWGEKYKYDYDNQITKQLHKKWHFGVSELLEENFILEGGSIDSDGEGTILTTSKCLLNPNRNPTFSKEQIEEKLKTTLGAKRVLWLNHGELTGDDTDAHIDTLARFVAKDTIAYVTCQKDDEHYEELEKMKKELESFETYEGKSYKLIPLPLPQAKYKNGQRLPATYANFLIANYVVLLPTYEDELDKQMISLFKELFPTREIIPINSIRLIEECGSIHCSTMQVGF